MLDTVNVPAEFEPVFLKAQECVGKYFKEKTKDPSKGTIEISGERYILVRAASMSVDFFETVRNLYKDAGEEEAIGVARSLLFDISHAIGKMDARNFHKKMGLESPIEKLSAGPIHFSHSGWAFVDILAQSRPSSDENYYLIYDHPFSFESDAWQKEGKKPDFPVCIMNAGYSSGWCEESFGIPLVASEILCRAKGDDCCRFIMAQPSKIEHYIQEYLKKEPEIGKRVATYKIPGFFERKQMEEALRASENQYRTLLENLPQKIFLKDMNLVYLSCNESYARDLKIKPEEIAEKTDYEFFPKELAEKYRADDKRVIESGKGESIEEQYPLNGQEIFVQTVKTPVKDEHGNVTGVLGIFWDITERKEAEQKQVELLKKVESANKELTDFAYVVSHDLKAPLRGIKTLAQWISTDYADKIDQNGRDQLNLMLSRADRMHNLIDGILQYSRVGRVKEEKVQVNLNELVAEVVDSIAPPQTISITVENDLPVIEFERTRIMQVFQNLLSNAVKYMDKPEGRIRIGCVEEGGFWKFSVADNGPGIEEKYFEKIFEMFQTLAPRDDVESTGVGLTVAKKIVELYGGRIWVESKVGEGSIFLFTLPKQETEVKDAQLQASIVG